MKPLLTLLILLLPIFRVKAQGPLAAYVKVNTQPVRSIDVRDDDMADLEVIGNAIGEARVVSLGEQDHGDAPAFKAKARLIKYLHEKKGFNVIAFESDFYSLVRGGDAALSKRETSMQTMMRNIFGIWTDCVECGDAFSYIDSTGRAGPPLQVTGFDNQLHGLVRSQQYSADMTAMLEKAGSRFTARISPLFTYAQRYYPLHADRVIPLDSLVYFDGIADSINQELQYLPDSSFLKIAMRSLRAYTSQQIFFSKDFYETQTVRDKQMAENFLWLYRYKYPGQKIIIWAHNYHIAKNTFAAFTSRRYGKHYSMGNELAKVLKDTMYILGFTSYSGRAGRIYVKPFKVPRPEKQSLETWMAVKDPAYAFVDLKAYREANPDDKKLFFMKGKFHSNAEAVWTDVFDGVFYIRDMYPCRRRE